MHLLDLRAEAESLAARLEDAAVGLAAGRGGPVDAVSAVQAFPLVTSAEAVPRLQELAAKAEGRRKRRLELLAAAAFDWRGWTVEPGRRMRFDSSGARPVETGEGALSVEELRWRLGRLEGEGLRKPLETAWLAQVEGRTDEAWRLADAATAVARASGSGSVIEGRLSLLGVDAAAFLADVRAFLSATTPAFREVGGWWLDRSTGARWFPGGASWHDGMRAWSGGAWSEAIPSQALARRVAGPFEAAGLDPVAGGRVRFDVEDREGKAGWSHVGGGDAPGTVRAVWRAQGGPAGLTSFLRVFGEALAQAWCDAERPSEDRLLGDHALTQASGVAMSVLALDRAWMRRTVGIDDTDFRRVVAWLELARLRQAALDVLHMYDVAAEGPGPSVDARSAERASEALGVRVPDVMPTVRLLERAWVPGSAPDAVLRAAALGWSLALGLRNRLDEDWWRNPRTGGFLKPAWAHGRFLRPSELVAQLDLPPHSVTDVGGRLVEAMSG